MGKQEDAVRGLEQAAAITKACHEAGIRDPLEIPALFEFAREAEQCNTAFIAYQRAEKAYNQFVATHGADDPGQEYFVAQLSAAKEVFEVAHRGQAVALQTWRAARGLDALRAALAA